MRIFLFIFFIMFYGSIQSQTTIKGKIKDSTNYYIPLANIILSDTLTGKIIKYTYSNSQGEFELKTEEIGTLHLVISALGYKKKIYHLKINKENNLIKLNPVLKIEPYNLDEVLINYKNPILIKKDTIIFDAKSFAQGNEEVVEDLLKKIPGLSIDAGGTIKIGNQEIERVMIEGDDFFERGYKILTKNMPAQPIKKIEVLQHYSRNRLLKGVEKSDKIALNLTLEENAKRKWFGNLDAGYGLVSKNRYEVRGNLMNFGKKNKYYFLTNLNNTGYDATGDIDNLVRSTNINAPGSIGDGEQSHSLINLPFNPPNFKRSRTNFNNAELFSLNAIFNPTEKLKIKTLGFFNSDETAFFRNSKQTFITNETNFTNTEDYSIKDKKKIGFGKVDLNYDISKTQFLNSVTKYNHGDVNGFSNLVFNGSSTLQNLETNDELFDQKISYTNKYKDNKVFLLTGRYIEEKSPQEYLINRFFYEGLFTGAEDVNNVAQSSQNRMQFAGIEAHLLDRRENGDLFELKVGNEFRRDELTSRFQLKENEVSVFSPEGFQNNTFYTVHDIYLKTKYRWEIKDFSFSAKADFHQFSDRLEYSGFFENNNPFFRNPSLGLDWKINSKNKIKTSYSFTTKNSGILDVYPNFVLTGFRSFNSGNGNFNQLNSSTFLVNYELGQWTDRFFGNFFMYYTKDYDFFSTRSIIEQNYSLSQKILFKNRELFSVNSEIDRYLKFIQSNIKLNLGYFQSNYKNIVNNSGERKINSVNYSYGMELRSGFSGVFNYHIGTKWKANRISTNSFSSSFTDNLTFLNLTFIFNDSFNIQFESERYFFGNLKTNPTYYFLDMEATYKIIPNKISLSLEGKNLFNTRTFRNYSINDLGTSTTTYRLLPRFALLSLNYRF